MTKEKSIVKAIKGYLESQGFVVFKLHGGPQQQAGLPDLLAIKDGQAYWFECKRPGEKATKIQEYMLGKLREAGCLVAVVSSVDEIREALKP